MRKLKEVMFPSLTLKHFQFILFVCMCGCDHVQMEDNLWFFPSTSGLGHLPSSVSSLLGKFQANTSRAGASCRELKKHTDYSRGTRLPGAPLVFFPANQGLCFWLLRKKTINYINTLDLGSCELALSQETSRFQLNP